MGKGESGGKATAVGKGIFVLSLDVVTEVTWVFTTTVDLPVTQFLKGG